MFSQLISTQNLMRGDIDLILQHAQKMEGLLNKKEKLTVMQGKIMAALFYEPSTRTRLSFETAMLRLGGQIVNAIGMENASFQKGETLSDTIKTIENYADVIVMRHPEKGSAEVAIQATQKPFLNAGDGAGEHPTQALLDLYTILQKKGTLDGLTVGFVGDLKFGRTVHSLVYLLAKFKVNLVFVSPEELQIPLEIKQFLDNQKIFYQETADLTSLLSDLDVLYVTRVQKERFENLTDYAKVKDRYLIDVNLLKTGKADLIVLHPLPRVNEIAREVDTLPQAAYFQQVKNSIPVRMALLDLVVNG